MTVPRRVVLLTLQVIGAILGQLMCVFRTSRFFYSRVNLRLCFPDENEKQIRQLAKQCMRETGKNLFEVLMILLCPRFFQRSIRQVHGEEHILRAREEGKSILLIGPHLGNWEVLNIYASQFHPCTSYKPMIHQWADRRMRHCREMSGTKLVSIHADGLKVMCAELNKGGMILMFPDQVPPKTAGRFMAPFFNVPAWTGTLVSRLAKRDNVVVICGFAERLAHGQGFDIYLQPAPAGIYSDELQQSVAAMNKGMENCILHCAQQYIWQYKRFKDNIPGLYKKSIAEPQALL